MACSDGNFLALGQTNGMGAGATDLYVVKFDINGNVLWERTCGGSNSDSARGICELSDGYLIVGTTLSFGNGNVDVFAEKLDFNGNSLWSQAYGTNGQELGGEPFLGQNGQIWIAGGVYVGTKVDGMLQRIDASGALIDVRRFGITADNEELFRIAPGGPGVVVSGNMWVNGQVRPGLAGFNASGGLVWSKGI
ncbi:MAG: hypothetical protein IPM98_20545 [Lewinellaceae bacterium]|nr:hypothetical protein [Lewinellaceae bacterium]